MYARSWSNGLHIIRCGAVVSTPAYKGNPTTFYLRRGMTVHASFYFWGNRTVCPTNRFLMKKLNFCDWIIVILFAGLMMPVVSCGKDDPEPSTLSVSMSSIVAEAAGSQESVGVTSNTNWTVEGASNWCSVSPSSGNGNGTLSIKIMENTAEESRECTLLVQTTDGALSKAITVKQNGHEVTLSTTPSELKFGSEKSTKKTLQISCNGDWTITNLPDWIDVDPMGGKGDRVVTFTTRSENSTANERKATVTITSGSSSVNVGLTQEAGLSSCYVEPESIVTLASSVAFLPTKHGNVKNYRLGYIKVSDFNKYTHNELLEVTREFTAFTDFDEVESIHMLRPDTEYYLVTLAYDMNDQEGELHKAAFTTKSNNDAQALVSIGEDIYYTEDNYIKWHTTPDGATDKYYTMFLSGLSVDEMTNLLYLYNDELYYDAVKLAWYLNNEIARKSDSFKIKKGEAEIVETSGFNIDNNKVVKRGQAFQLGYSVFFTWGINISDEKLSGIARVTSIFNEYNSISKKNEVKKFNKFNGKKINRQIK